jgi:hypothetical protein
MSVDDTALARVLYGVVEGSLAWLDDYPSDQVDPAGVARFRDGAGWVLGRLPSAQRERLAAGDPDPASLPVVAGLLVDLMWWLDTRDDDEVDPHLAVKLQESAAVDDLPDGQRQRLLDIVNDLAATEPHDARRFELRFFPFAIGLVDDEPDGDPPAPRDWIHPADRA